MVNMVDNKALKVFTYIFFALVVADIIALNIYDGQSVFTADNFILHVFIKPLIMLSAICFLIKYLSHKIYHNWMLVAFIYSLLGDILLLGQGINEIFFIGGLTAFFLAQTGYIIYFHRSKIAGVKINRTIQSLQTIVIVFAIGFYLLMLPNLGLLSIPVLLYLIIIALMGVVALGRYGHVNFHAFFYTMIGAFAFILSDSLIAYNKFIDVIPFANSLTMLFYCIAQYMILRGFIALRTPQVPRA